MIIRDPSTGQAVGVNASRQLLSRSTIMHEEHWINETVEEVYTAVINSDPSAADADFFYLKNDSDYDLIIFAIKGWLDPSGTGPLEVAIKLNVTGTPGTPSTITPVNMTAGSGNKAECTAYQRDGDMALTGGDIVDWFRIDEAALEEQFKYYTSGIRLKKNATLIFNNSVDPVGHTIDMTVYFYFHKPSETQLR